VAAATTLHESRSSSPRRLDTAGALTFGASMACLNAGLVQGRSGWTSTETIALLAAGALFLAAFGWIELRGRMPMLDLHLFREPLFVASITGALFTGLAVIGLLSFSPTLFQRGLGMSTLESAAVLGTWSVTSMVVAYAAPRLPARFRSHTRLSIGLAVIAAGELALTGLGSHSTWAAVVPGLVVAGIGSGLANAALGRLAVESVPRDHAGMGSGANNTARYVGGAAGVALVVAVISATGAGPADPRALVNGWNSAALVSAGLCAAGALVAGFCRPRA
jgi:Na+/melibiose symporter-like transporter